MLTDGGQLNFAAQMKLGFGNVAVGCTLANKYGCPKNQLWSMYLVFGFDSGKFYSIELLA